MSIKGGPIPGEPDPLVIKSLEDTLSLAREGICMGVCIAWVNADGAAQWTISARQIYSLIAAVNFMLHDILSTKQREREVEDS